MESLHLGLGAALLMGFLFGAGPCNISCLPYLGPVFLGQEGNRRAWRTIIPFSLGRLLGYGALGGVAGGLGHLATAWVQGGPAGIVLGVLTVAVGLLLWRRAGRPAGCHSAPGPEQRVRWIRPRRDVAMPAGLVGMGMAMALNPCMPLGTVLLAAAASASIGSGLTLGLSFGVGAVAVPSLVFGVLVAHFGRQVRAHLAVWGRTLERSAAGLMIGLGVITAMGWVQP